MPLTRFRLQTFGRLALFDPAGAEHPLTKRRRQLAVLAYLALADRPVSRDTLATMFWGEEAEERARHSLSNTLSALRGALGKSAIDLGRFEVALGPATPLDIDAREVARAAAQKDWAGVIARVTGPFLDGVFVEGSNQFEDWLSAERRRVEQWVAQGSAHESARLLEAGAYADAARVADAWLAAAPLDTDAILVRLRAEAADGSPEAVRRTTALHARIVQRLQQEFGPRIDRRVAGFLATIDRQAPAVSEVPASLPAPAVSEVPASLPAPAPSSPQVPPSAPNTNGPTTASPPRASGPTSAAPPRRRRAVRLVVGLVALAAAGGLAAAAFNRPARPAWVLVADLERGGGDSLYDGSVPLALGTSLAQSRTTQVVSRSRLLDVLQQMQLADSVRGVGERTALEAAARIGADIVVVPTLAQVGDRIVLGARLLDAESGGVLATERVDLSGDGALLDAVDEIARRVRRRLGESALALREVTPLPQATTASLPALRAYAAGLRAQEDERFAEAVTAFRAALAFDSTFAQAHVALGAALASAGEADEAERRLVRAMALAERLPAREAMLVRRTAAMARRDWDAAVAIGADWLARFPRDREALDKQAYALFRGRRIPDALDVYRRLLAVDSLDANAWLNFASALPFTEATLDEKMSAYGRATQLYPEFATGITVNHEIGGALARGGRYDSAAVVFTRMLALDATHRARGHRSLGYLAMWRGAYGEAVDAFGEAVTWQRATGEAVGEVRARLARARALRGLERSDEAAVELDSALAVTLRQRMDLVIAAWVGKELARAGQLDGVSALQRLVRERRVSERPGDRVASLLLDAEAATARGEAAQGLALLDSLVRVDSSSIVQESRAHAAFAAGRYEQAAALYARLAASPEFGWEGSEGTRLAPYWAARAAEARGDTAAARRGYAAFVRSWDAPDAGLVLVREARERMGGGR